MKRRFVLDGQPVFNWRQLLPSLVTLSAMLSGFLSILVTIEGLGVLQSIKERWPESEVVVVTGYPSIETAKEAVKLGAYDYLAKPVVPDAVLRATTGAWMQKRWALQREPASGVLRGRA